MVSLKYALIFIINFVFDTYIFILLLRLLLQKMGANWHNPVSQLVIKVTEPVVKPLPFRQPQDPHLLWLETRQIL